MYLDLSQKQRPTMRIKLPDDTIIDVLTPTKSVKDTFTYLGETLIRVGEGTASEDDLESMYDITAQIISRNRQRIEFTRKDLEDCMDTEDIVDILGNYANFITNTIQSKN